MPVSVRSPQLTSAPAADVTPGSPKTNSGDDEKLARGRIIAAIIFALLAIAFFVTGVILGITPVSQLPGFLGHSPSGHRHTLRGVGSILVGLVFTVSAWFSLRYRSLALVEAREADLAPARAGADRPSAAAAGQPPAAAAGQPAESVATAAGESARRRSQPEP
jgi:hypothetical protein